VEALEKELIGTGLRETRGNYRSLVGLLNMPATDYKRFLNFLKKQGCHVAFQPFRTVATVVGAAEQAA